MQGTNTGRVIEIKGVVLDAVFSERLPEIYTALEIEVARPGGNTDVLVAEVQQHLGDVRRYGGTDLGPRRCADARTALERHRRPDRRGRPGAG
jgi:hypothetical protein